MRWIIFALALPLLTSACTNDTPPATGKPVTSQPAGQSEIKPAEQKSDRVVVIDTSKGKIVIELTPDQTPITVKNFLSYMDEKFYDGTIFHRVINGFMIQGGGFTADLQEKTTHDSIKNESQNGLSNTRGTIAMARRGPPDSATSQFFINLGDNSRLNYPANGGGYCAFGKVVEGMDVVDNIAKVPTRQGSVSEGEPLEMIKINSIARK